MGSSCICSWTGASLACANQVQQLRVGHDKRMCPTPFAEACLRNHAFKNWQEIAKSAAMEPAVALMLRTTVATVLYGKL